MLTANVCNRPIADIQWDGHSTRMMVRHWILVVAAAVAFTGASRACATCLLAQTRPVHLTKSRLLFWFDSTDDAALIDPDCPNRRVGIVSGGAANFQPLHRAIFDARDRLRNEARRTAGDVVALAEVNGDYMPHHRVVVKSIRLIGVYTLIGGKLENVR